MGRNGLAAILILVVGIAGAVFFKYVLVDEDEVLDPSDKNPMTATSDDNALRKARREGKLAPRPDRDDGDETETEADEQINGAAFLGRLVTQHDKKPVAGAQIMVTTILGVEIRTTASNAEGHFELGPLPPAQEFVLRASKDDFAIQAIPALFLKTGEKCNLGDLELSRSSFIQGVVVTAGGKPLAGADVALLPNVSFNPMNIDFVRIMRALYKDDDPLAIAKTNSEGAFRFDDVVEGEYAVAVIASGYQFKHSEKIDVKPAAAVEKVKIELAQGKTLTGIVKDAKGLPVGDALIVMLPDTRGMPTVIKTQKKRSGPDGKFKFSTLGPGRYHCMVSDDSHAYWGQKLTIADHEDKEVEVVLEDDIHLVGRVYNETTGEGIEGVEIIVMSNNAPVINEAVSDADGKYLVRGIRKKGHVLAFVRHDDYDLITAEDGDNEARLMGGVNFRLEGMESDEIVRDFAMTGGGSITGRVYDIATNKGIAGALIKAYDAGNNMLGGFVSQPEGSVTTDAEGRYVLKKIKPGKIIVMVAAKAYQMTNPPPLAKDLWAISQDDNGNTIEETEIQVFPEVTAGQTLAGQDIPMELGLSQNGRVVDPKGQAVAGATIQWHTASENKKNDVDVAQLLNMAASKVITDAQGKFLIEGIRAGQELKIIASHPDFAGGGKIEIAASEVGQKKLSLTVNLGAHLTGKVVGPDGQGVANVEVSLRLPSASTPIAKFNNHPRRTTTSDIDGRYEFKDLPLGEATISIKAPRGFIFGGENRKVVLKSGRTKTIDLKLVRVITIEGIVVDHHDKPLPGAYIRAIPADVKKGQQSWQRQRAGHTTSNGHFIVERTEEGVTYVLNASKSIHLDPKPGDSPEATAEGNGLAVKRARGAMRTAQVELRNVVAGQKNVKIVLDTTPLDEPEAKKK